MARRSPTPGADAKQQQQQAQAQLIGKVMGPMLGVFSWFWPTGLVVYFASSNIFRVGQQALIFRLDGDGSEDSGNGAKRKQDTPDGGSSQQGPQRGGPSPHASKKKKGRRK